MAHGDERDRPGAAGRETAGLGGVWTGPTARYDDDGRAASALVYHVVLVTRRRRPLFREGAVARRVEALLGEAAGGAGCALESCEVGASWVRLAVRAPSTLSPHIVVTRLRRDAAGPLKREVEEARRTGAVFVRRYLVSTGPVSDADCAAFRDGVSRA
jgi:REP element-mobilizing transposase RayT